jgi:PadR family transcriptional regulator PadR
MTARDLDDLSGGLPKNFIRPCLLLLVGEESSHGYDLLERLRDMGLKRIDPGGLYRALRTMEQEGLLESSWEASDLGPPRRTYRLTDEGRDWMHAWAATLREGRRVIGNYLSRYDALDDVAVDERRGRAGRPR